MKALQRGVDLVVGYLLSVGAWYAHRTNSKRYRAQAHIVAAWVVREVCRVLRGGVNDELLWQLDQFQLFLSHAIYLELVKNRGYYPISNSPFQSPAALFDQAIRAARIYPPEPVLLALPHMRIRIVPGWVKVYSIGRPEDAPLTLYPERYARSRGRF